MEDIKNNSWNKKNENYIKGTKQFQSLPGEIVKDTRIFVRLSGYQKDILADFCKNNNPSPISMSDLVRFAIYEYLKKNNVNIDEFKSLNTVCSKMELSKKTCEDVVNNKK